MWNPNDPAPDFGYFKDLSFPEYLAINALSTSEIKKFETTLNHWQAELGKPQTDSAALRIGSAADLLVQPDGVSAFHEEMAVLSPDINLRTKAGRETRDALRERFGLNGVMKESEFRTAEKCARALKENSDVDEMLEGAIAHQPVLVWKDPNSGVPRKARLDLLTELSSGLRVINDWKTILSGSAHARYINTYCYNYKYHWQAYSYLEGAQQCQIRVDEFRFTFVDSSPPYDVAVRTMHESFLQIAAKELDDRLKKIHYALTTGDFQGYETEGVIWPPKWVKDRLDKEESPVSASPLSNEARDILEGNL